MSKILISSILLFFYLGFKTEAEVCLSSSRYDYEYVQNCRFGCYLGVERGRTNAPNPFLTAQLEDDEDAIPLVISQDMQHSGQNSSQMLKRGSEIEFVVVVGNRVKFDNRSYKLNSQQLKKLKRSIAWLLLYPRYSILIEAHADDQLSREDNFDLSEKRGETVKRILIESGVDASRIVGPASYGSERKINLCTSEFCRAENRRVTLITFVPKNN